MKILLALLFFIFFGLTVNGQPGSDTIRLNNVVIEASPIEKYITGANVVRLDSAIISRNSWTDIGTLISKSAPVYIKSYGNGMSSSIAVRGTGSSHTAVMWEGININSPSLGMADLSAIPVTTQQNITFVHGSASPFFGTGSIGGAIDIRSDKINSGFVADVGQATGSFGTFNTNGNISWGSGNAGVAVNGAFGSSKNDYPIESSYRERQENGEFDRHTLGVNGFLNLGSNSVFSIVTQYINMDRNLQPAINALNKKEFQKDKNWRGVLKYNYEKGAFSADVSLAYLHDFLIYHTINEIVANQKVAQLNLSHEVSQTISYRLGSELRQVNIDNFSYGNGNASEQRADVYGSLLFNPSHCLNMTLNLRQSFVEDEGTPFTPSLGIEYLLLKQKGQSIKIKSLISKGYRIPTLNDKFWVPGGNMDLKAEESISAEFGLGHKINRNDWELSSNITAYNMLVDDWILWQLTTFGYWSPINIKNVHAYGLEVSEKAIKKLKQGSISGWLNYGLSKSINKTKLNKYDRTRDKQLTYTPIHNIKLGLSQQLTNWGFNLDGGFTSKRYTTADNEDVMPGYALVNMSVTRKFSCNAEGIDIRAQVNNIMDTRYESILNRAMPGRAFLIELIIHFKQ